MDLCGEVSFKFEGHEIISLCPGKYLEIGNWNWEQNTLGRGEGESSCGNVCFILISLPEIECQFYHLLILANLIIQG